MVQAAESEDCEKLSKILEMHPSCDLETLRSNLLFFSNLRNQSNGTQDTLLQNLEHNSILYN